MASTLLNAALFQPIGAWPAGSAVHDVEAKQQPEQQMQMHCVALAGSRLRLYVPRTYIMALLAVIGAYLGAIFTLDSIACEDTVECRNYSKLENAFSQSSVLETLDMWTAKGRAAMALSAGLHIFSAFLFTQLFIFGGVALRERFMVMGSHKLERAISAVPYIGRVFNAFYVTVHSLNASMIVGGNPSKATPVVAGVLLIISLVLLIISALSIIIGAAYCLIWYCCLGGRSCSSKEAAVPISSSSEPAMAVVVVP